VVLTAASNGTMYPLEQLSKEETLLKGYFWAEQERPKDKMDVFARPPHTLRPGEAMPTMSEQDEKALNKKERKKKEYGKQM